VPQHDIHFAHWRIADHHDMRRRTARTTPSREGARQFAVIRGERCAVLCHHPAN
jgi:hypothetical protein